MLNHYNGPIWKESWSSWQQGKEEQESPRWFFLAWIFSNWSVIQKCKSFIKEIKLFWYDWKIFRSVLSRCKPITGLVEPKRQLWRRSGLRPFPQKPPCNFLELQGHPERIRKVNQFSSALNFTNMAFSSFFIWALAATVKEEWAAPCVGKNHLAISSSYIVIQKIYNVIQNKITSIIDATLKRKILHPRDLEI